MKKIILPLLFALVLLSCSKDDNLLPESQTSDNVVNTVLERILSLGFSAESIEEFEDYYIVEGDILFWKNDTTENPSISRQQARDEIAYLETTIKVYIEPNFSYLYNNILTATYSVVQAYNNLPTKLKFVVTSNKSEANITITCNNLLGNNVCGMGGFPSNGKVFPTIWLSESVLRSASITGYSQLIFLIAHEMGHNLGLRHTDWWRGEVSAIHISGTPTADANSVMNMATCGYSWRGFSQGDSDALHAMYTPTAFKWVIDELDRESKLVDNPDETVNAWWCNPTPHNNPNYPPPATLPTYSQWKNGVRLNPREFCVHFTRYNNWTGLFVDEWDGSAIAAWKAVIDK